MKKFFGIILALVLALTLVFAVSAADTTVYVKDGGTGNGSSASAPLGTLTAAAKALSGKGGTIVLCGDTTISAITTIPEQSGDLTITAQNGAKLVIKSRLQFAKNTNANTVTLDVPMDVPTEASWYMFGGYNSVVFTENCEMTQSGGGGIHFYGGVNAKDAASIDDCIATLPFSITVNNGNFLTFNGGVFRSAGDIYIGSVAAPVTVTINGGTFGTVGDYSDALSAIKTFTCPFSISGMGFVAYDVTLTINGGVFNAPLYISGRIGTTHSPAQNVSKKIATDAKYYAQDGDVNITITGGTFNGGAVCDTYVDAGYSRLMRGDYTVKVTGGTFKDGTVFDATQVKAYAGENKKATITYPENLGITAKRFDVVNGKNVTYKEPTRVAFIGDSITEGHSSGNPLLYSYPAQYLSLELAAGSDVIVSDLGVSASGMLPSTKYYYPEMLPAPLALGEVDADIYFFALGTNDAFTTGASNGTYEHFYDEYKTFIKACGDNADTDAVYVSSALFRGRGVGPYSMRAANVMRPLQQRIATELATTDASKYHFVDLYTLTLDEVFAEKLFTTDNLHPHADGYAIMAQDVYNAIHKDIYGVDNFTMSDVYISSSGAEYGAGTKTDPASSLSLALSKCAPGATIHVVGVFNHDTTVAIPEGLGTITLKGEGTGAAINFTADATFRIASDLKVDNLAITTASGKYVAIFGEYHNVTFTESVTTSGDVQFYAGRLVREDREQMDVYTTTTYDTEETASSNADVTVNILGGTFTALSGGNRRYASHSPYGTYSGNMVFNVGKNVTVTSATNSGIVGMNYLTGSVTASINGWGTVAIKENMRLGSMLGDITYNRRQNTGNVTLSVADNVTADVVYTCDINADDAVNVKDVLSILTCLVDGESAPAFYEAEELSLLDALFILKKLAA